MLRLIPAVLLLTTTAFLAQTEPTAPATPAEKASQATEASINERTDIRTDFDSDGRSRSEYSTRIRVASQAAVQNLGIITFLYQNTSQKLEVEYVRVVKPDGTVVVTDPETFQDVSSEISRVAPT